MNKVALITGQNGAYLSEPLIKKEYIAHGLKRKPVFTKLHPLGYMAKPKKCLKHKKHFFALDHHLEWLKCILDYCQLPQGIQYIYKKKEFCLTTNQINFNKTQ